MSKKQGDEWQGPYPLLKPLRDLPAGTVITVEVGKGFTVESPGKEPEFHKFSEPEEGFSE